MANKDFVFTRDSAGKLQLVADFEGLYANEEEPWSQSAQGDDANYYLASRLRVVDQLQAIKPHRVLEVGTGLGYALDFFYRNYEANYCGMDISTLAIEKAKERFPQHSFVTGNIGESCIKSDTNQKFDCVILNQLLWYILDDLDQVVENCANFLKANGTLIISNAFARKQEFGNDIIDGFSGACKKFEQFTTFKLVSCCFNDNGFRNNDGLFTFTKN
jgi:SAM-dependent methyltransferase